ncbi:MAG: TIGR02281 family clan AA aspartic protease [Rhodospirillales bacterium]
MIGWALRQLLQWTLLGAVAVGVYTHKDRIFAAMRGNGADRPAAAVDAANGGGDGASRTVRIAAAANGHYFVDAEIDGTPVHFVVDTGATVVALNLVDADKLGIEPRERDFSETHQTANGLVRVAPVTLPEVRIGHIRLRNVDAVVNTRMRGPSLLGMSFLGRLGGFRVERGELILSD